MKQAKALAAALATLTIACATGAYAGTRDPAGACGAAAYAEPYAQLTLGHFSGGRIVRAVDGVPLIVWRDEYQCFTSRRICDVWQRRMNAAYRNVEGYKTCLPLR